MIYDNITYPLDKIYSNATGVSYPVCAAGHDNAQPTPTPDPTPDQTPDPTPDQTTDTNQDTTPDNDQEPGL